MKNFIYLFLILLSISSYSCYEQEAIKGKAIEFDKIDFTKNNYKDSLEDNLLNNLYKKFSADHSYYFVSKPYADQLYDTLGVTTIYKKNGEKLWEIGRYFSKWSTFLNNKGDALTFVNDFAGDSHFTEEETVILFYKNGALVKDYKLKDVFKEPTAYGTWVYTVEGEPQEINGEEIVDPDSVQSIMGKKNLFTQNEILNIITSERQIISMNLNNGQINRRINDAYNYVKNYKIKYDSLQIIGRNVAFNQFGLPKLTNGQDFEMALAEFLGLTLLSGDEVITDRRKLVGFELHLLINKDGKAEIISVDEENEKIKSQIKKFVERNTFSTNYHDPDIDKMKFFSIILMERNKTKPNNS
ncbi:hypothetical protein [Adhaeribacter pallidiroseus]|uniref:Uncharacterized protein n=1 Tax=Adhaeribacter pallidiroseus TaxID=2072847 RepID=A0A369QAT4_9BACT|nr:hypothetical protein [Adhaeribacter pallidiroseus]RDC62033.1 hypothetical protein AHMF7616_00623 [Adhaeribacter pallidiroseus]